MDLTDIKNSVCKLQVVYKGYIAVEKRKAYASQEKERCIKTNVSSNFTDFQLIEFNPNNLEDPDQDFNTKYVYTSQYIYTSQDFMDRQNKMIYIQPVLINILQREPI